MTTASYWIEKLRLVKHPEGGYYRETYRALLDVSTAIYFLLPAGEVSLLHRIKSDEVWHFYAGSPLTIQVLGEAAIELSAAMPQAVVPGGRWFGATVAGEFALAGCTVAPGFDFQDFEMGDRTTLLRQFPQHRQLIERLTK
ncbi:MAG: cupin domain-containing protein [Verrucomicrobiota bacterium]